MDNGNIHQLEAERTYVLVEIVSELGGLAHEGMSAAELDTIVDNMLSKGVPNALSKDLQRWIHTHRLNTKFKIAQILGAHVTKASSIIPECFGKFYDATAVECKACLDRTACKMKSKPGAVIVPVTTLYGVGNANAQTISAVLAGKQGQIAKALAHGSKVILSQASGKLKVLAVDSDNPTVGKPLTEQEDNTMAVTKGVPAKSVPAKSVPAKSVPAKAVAKPKPVVEEEEEVELDLSGLGEVEEAAEESEESPETEEVAEVEEVAEAPAPKPAKVKVEKPKPVLNKHQQDFQDNLDKRTGPDKQKYSATVAKQLKLDVVTKGDERIDHMARVMAIKKHLGSIKVAAKK